ncbi:MAG TPA: zinc ABC transporter substrate-binding protein [Longimicrobium sp.]
MNIVTSTAVVRDMVQNVAGPRDVITALMGPGTDPHLYPPLSRELPLLLHADLVFIVGLMLEPSLVKAEDEDRSERIDLKSVAGGIRGIELLGCPTTGRADPHVWFDIPLWAERVDSVAWHLSRRFPVHAAEYAASAERYRARLMELHAWVRAQVARVPPQRRVLVTAHDAFGYLGRAYGFRVRGLQGVHTTALASTEAEVQALAEFVVRDRVPVVFTETSVGTGGLERVQRAARERGWDVRVAGPLYSDAMGKRDTPHGTYEGMMRHNVDTIVGALLADGEG